VVDPGDRRKPQVGDEVFPNQPIIALPDASQFIVDLRVREVDLHRVSIGQRVDVEVDAYPELRLVGEIALVGALAQEDSSRAGTKYFPVTVRLTTADARLRPGMTARVSVHVRTIPDALLVPIEAVFTARGKASVFVLHGTSWRRGLVTVLGESDSHVAIADGLVDGEHVLLVDPTGPGEP
jgi:HlyD family secretion protein